MSQSMSPQSISTKVVLIFAALGLMPVVAAEDGKDEMQVQNASSPQSGQAIDAPAEKATPASSNDLPDTFAALDRNGNGILSEEEGAQIKPERWQRMDSNDDGKIDRSEFDAVDLDTSLTK